MEASSQANSVDNIFTRKGDSLVIMAMGLSHRDFVLEALYNFSPKAVADELWAINACGGLIRADKIIMMDDIRWIEAEAEKGRKDFKHWLGWLRKEDRTPIITCKAYEDYPTTVAYPLEDVLNDMKFAYMNSTVAYAVALAIHMEYKTLFIVGCDFTYPNVHQAEAGRGCVEYWIATAMARGINVVLPETTTLLDQHSGRKLYGYVTAPKIEVDQETQTCKVTFEE